MDWNKLIEENATLKKAAAEEEQVWMNEKLFSAEEALAGVSLGKADIEDAKKRLERFAPFIMKVFPETAPQNGLIESPLVKISNMQTVLAEKHGMKMSGQLYLKQDSHLAIAGSVKARGGIYEVLKHAEELALENGILKESDDYSVLASPENREFFSKYKIQVGSTGNLGLSIGIMSATLGFQVIVHMSADAKQWKKDLLRKHGVIVKEYASDYSVAVEEGRKLSDEDPMSYFVDDENSASLFLGYAVAAERLAGQLAAQGIQVDEAHPLFVYIPCGVGGAPGGVTFGLKHVFGDAVHCFFVEPVKAPCMLAGMASGLHNEISVQDIGLSGLTEADGLAVGRPSSFVGGAMEHMLCGIFTIQDENLYPYMKELVESENIFIEPSACASFAGPVDLLKHAESREYVEKNFTDAQMEHAVHICWATGGRLVPEEMRKEYMSRA